jgi:hypothetical protein
MGFKELIGSGQFTTNRVTVPIPDNGSGTTQNAVSGLGSTYVLLGISAANECRVRLYSTSQSVALDAPRAPLDFVIDPEVGLNLEAYMSGSSLSFTFDPPILATSFDGSNTWFNISSSVGSPPNVQILAHPLEFQNIVRAELPISRSVTTGTAVSGSVTTPKSFLILSGSATAVSRLRLYSTDLINVPSGERTRDFGVQPPSGSKLIADLMFDSASFSYKINPVLEAYTWDGVEYTSGTGTVHYILENRAGGTLPVTASLHILSLED